MIDLHLHTSMSDGSDTPLELLDKVIAADCNVFSVTDHDDLRANKIILSAINDKTGIKFVTGCEISAVFEECNIHLLCYGFDPDFAKMQKLIADGASLRKQRVAAMLVHLRDKHGIIIPDKEKAEILNRDIPGKVHITDAAMKLGIKMTRKEFFDTRLDDMDSREFKISAHRVIATVSEAGGVVSLAHPIELQREHSVGFEELAAMAVRLNAAGLTAIEAFHSAHDAASVAEYLKIAARVGLLISGGSDYHGKNKEVKIGTLTAHGYLPPDHVLTVLNVFNH